MSSESLGYTWLREAFFYFFFYLSLTSGKFGIFTLHNSDREREKERKGRSSLDAEFLSLGDHFELGALGYVGSIKLLFFSFFFFFGGKSGIHKLYTSQGKHG